jgi:1-deoxy-D-xylulose-5-phosphate synthase
LNVVLAMDRAGLVGDDGPTHHGAFDIAYLRCLPNIVLMAPRDEAMLVQMLRTALEYNDGPIALRYPRGEGVGVTLPREGRAVPIGTGEILREAGTAAAQPGALSRRGVAGSASGSREGDMRTPARAGRMGSGRPAKAARRGKRVALIGYGTGVGKALDAAEELAAAGVAVTVADARFAKPIDAGLVAQLAAEHDLLVTVEEGVLAGGFGSAVWETLNDAGATPRILRVGLPDRYVTHGKPALLHEEVGFTASRIAERVRAAISDSEQAARAPGSATVGA